MTVKVESLEWKIIVLQSKVTAELTFVDSAQSERFLQLLVDFLQKERGPPEILDDIAWYCPLAKTGKRK